VVHQIEWPVASKKIMALILEEMEVRRNLRTDRDRPASLHSVMLDLENDAMILMGKWRSEEREDRRGG